MALKCSVFFYSGIILLRRLALTNAVTLFFAFACFAGITAQTPTPANKFQDAAHLNF